MAAATKCREVPSDISFIRSLVRSSDGDLLAVPCFFNLPFYQYSIERDEWSQLIPFALSTSSDPIKASSFDERERKILLWTGKKVWSADIDSKECNEMWSFKDPIDQYYGESRSQFSQFSIRSLTPGE